MTRTITILLPPPPGSPSPAEMFKTLKSAPNPSGLEKKGHTPLSVSGWWECSTWPFAPSQPTATASEEQAVQRCFLPKKELRFNYRYRKKRAITVPMLQAELLGGIIGSIQYLVSNSLIHTSSFCQSNLSAGTWSCTIHDFSLCWQFRVLTKKSFLCSQIKYFT